MKIVPLLLLLLSSACTSEPLEPLGQWNTTWTWGAGTCGATGTVQDSMTIVDDGSGYTALVTNPNLVSVSGTISCDHESCQLVSTRIGMVNTSRVETHLTLVLDDEEQISGAGTASIVTSPSCQQSFAAAGHRQ